jgi:peptidyl-prolyl cis-trans isomerase SurA
MCSKKAVLILALLGAVGLSHGYANEKAQAVDGFAAVVNERVITMGDVLDFIQPNILQLRDVYAGEELDRKREEAYTTGLQLLVDQALIVEEFKKSGGAIPDRLVNDRINEVIFDQFENDRAKFLAALAEEQITLEDWRERIRERLIVSALRQQEINDRVQVTPENLRQAYEKNRAKFSRPQQVKLSMITLRKDRSADETAAREEAVRLRGRLLAGESFTELAREFSHDPKAANGGDWGWITPKDLRAELRQGLEALKLGDVSDILETPEALYVARIEEQRAAYEPTLEELRPELEKEVRRAEVDRLYQAWMERLKRKHAIKIF